MVAYRCFSHLLTNGHSATPSADATTAAGGPVPAKRSPTQSLTHDGSGESPCIGLFSVDTATAVAAHKPSLTEDPSSPSVPGPAVMRSESGAVGARGVEVQRKVGQHQLNVVSSPPPPGTASADAASKTDGKPPSGVPARTRSAPSVKRAGSDSATAPCAVRRKVSLHHLNVVGSGDDSPVSGDSPRIPDADARPTVAARSASISSIASSLADLQESLINVTLSPGGHSDLWSPDGGRGAIPKRGGGDVNTQDDDLDADAESLDWEFFDVGPRGGQHRLDVVPADSPRGVDSDGDVTPGPATPCPSTSSIDSSGSCGRKNGKFNHRRNAESPIAVDQESVASQESLSSVTRAAARSKRSPVPEQRLSSHSLATVDRLSTGSQESLISISRLSDSSKRSSTSKPGRKAAPLGPRTAADKKSSALQESRISVTRTATRSKPSSVPKQRRNLLTESLTAVDRQLAGSKEPASSDKPSSINRKGKNAPFGSVKIGDRCSTGSQESLLNITRSTANDIRSSVPKQRRGSRTESLSTIDEESVVSQESVISVGRSSPGSRPHGISTTEARDSGGGRSAYLQESLLNVTRSLQSLSAELDPGSWDPEDGYSEEEEEAWLGTVDEVRLSGAAKRDRYEQCLENDVDASDDGTGDAVVTSSWTKVEDDDDAQRPFAVQLNKLSNSVKAKTTPSTSPSSVKQAPSFATKKAPVSPPPPAQRSHAVKSSSSLSTSPSKSLLGPQRTTSAQKAGPVSARPRPRGAVPPRPVWGSRAARAKTYDRPTESVAAASLASKGPTFTWKRPEITASDPGKAAAASAPARSIRPKANEPAEPTGKVVTHKTPSNSLSRTSSKTDSRTQLPATKKSRPAGDSERDHGGDWQDDDTVLSQVL